MKIAYFSPLPPTRSGIADYSRDLLPALADAAEVALFCAAPELVSAEIRSQYPIYPLEAYEQLRWRFDLPLYNMGNSPNHAAIWGMVQRYPGVVILHDHVLHHFLATQNYGRELAYAFGVEQGWEILFGRKPPHPYQNPLNNRLLDLSLGVIVHSQFVSALLKESHGQLPVGIVPQVMPLPVHRVDGDRSGLIFASIGQVTASKHLSQTLTAFATFAQRHPQAKYHIVGEAVDVNVTALLADLPPEVQSNVVWHDYIEEWAEFEQVIDSADSVFNLRYPTAGETSAAALRALAQGKPLIVYDIGWYSELPDSVAIKIQPNDPAALVQAMETIRLNHAEISTAARAYIGNHHAPRLAATKITAFLADVLQTINQRFTASSTS